MKARWSKRFRCQTCRSTSYYHLKGRDVYQCKRCKRQVSLISGPKQAAVAHVVLTQHKNGISARALRRQLGVSYNTVWLLKHKLMQAMIQRDSDQALGGIVQMDDAYWGGERHGGGTRRGSPGKTPFVVAVQCNPNGHPMAIWMDVVPGFRKTVLAAWAQRHLVHGTS